MKKPWSAISVLVLAGMLILVLSFCRGQKQAGKKDQAIKSAASRVDISGYKYQPAKITVLKGARVTWTNSDPVFHTVTADNDAFDSKQLGSNKSFTQKFNRPGAFRYFCEIHPYMKGMVTVKSP